MATIRDLRARFTATAQGFKSTVQGIKSDLDQVGESGAESSQKANDGFGKLKTTLLGFAGAYLGFEAIKGAVGGVISITDEYQKSLNTLQTKTGATKEEMEGMNESLKNIYANNYGESFTDIADSMSLVKTNTGLAGKELEKATQNAIMLRDTFEYDVAESTKVADTMMKQFGITSDQAFTLMAQGSQEGLDKSGDMMDSFNEYSVYFKTLGYDAEGMWNVFKAGADGGAFNMDKVGDSIKEFGIRAKDGSKTTSDAYTQLGMDADKMAQAIAKGGPTAQKAMQETFLALSKIDDPVARNTAGVALFGATFEDLEQKTILALGTVQDTANSTGDTLKKIDEVKYNNIGSAFEGMKRQIIVGLLEPIEKQVMPMLNTFINFAKQNMPQIKDAIMGAFTGLATFIQMIAPTAKNLFDILMNVGSVVLPILIGAFAGMMVVLTPILEGLTGIIAKFTEWGGFGPLVIGLATALGTYLAIQKASVIWTNLVTTAVKAWALAQRLLNLAMTMNPIGIVIALIAGLVAGLIYAYKNSETFRNIVQNAFKVIGAVAKAVLDWFIKTIPVWIANMVAWFKGLGDKITGIFNALKAGVMVIWNALKNAVMLIITTWINLVKAYFNAWKTAILFIFNALKTGAVAVFNALKNGALAIFNALKSGIINSINALKNGVINTVNFIKNGVVNAFNSAKSLAISAWNALKSGITNIIGNIKSAVTGMKDKIISTIKGISLFQMGKDMIQGLINGIKNMAGSLVKSAKGVVDGAISGAKKLLGINSPSRVFMEFGEFTGEGLAIGMEKMKGLVRKATGVLTDASFGTINSAELNPITATVDGGGQPGQTGANYNAPLMHIENYHQNDETDVRSISNGLYNLQRNSDRKKGR